MRDSRPPLLSLTAEECQRAARTHDPRFDGVFFIGVITTRIYCRPICPARVSVASHRRFFVSAAAAERAGYRPCLRCRPELAPGRAPVDAVSRLAFAAARRIGAGALNGRSVADLAHDLRVSERHLRRALEREVGVSPVELAQTHRLLLAKRLLADTSLPVTRIAFDSGFQSLRRFNSVFRERYGLNPSSLRRASRPAVGRRASAVTAPNDSSPNDSVRLTLAYRAPFAWDVLLRLLARDALPGVEIVQGGRYGRTVRVGGRSGVVLVEDAAAARRRERSAAKTHLDVDVSLSLVPALLPLLARLRHLFDLDAEPAVIDAHLAEGGLGTLLERRRGLRIPGAFDGFEAALGAMLGSPGARGADGTAAGALRRLLTRALGEPLATGVPGLDRLAPTAERVAEAGAARLWALGVGRCGAVALAAVARAIADRQLALEPGGDLDETHRALRSIAGVSDRLATEIVMRTLYWPDAFPVSDPALQRAVGASGARELGAIAERWRPWRAYAALHLRLQPS